MRAPLLIVFFFYVADRHNSSVLAIIEQNDWNTLKYRRVQHYGYAFDYTTNNVNKSAKMGPLPDIFAAIAARIARDFAPNLEFDQLTVNEYLPGQGIKPHVDTHSAFEEPIVRPFGSIIYAPFTCMAPLASICPSWKALNLCRCLSVSWHRWRWTFATRTACTPRCSCRLALCWCSQASRALLGRTALCHVSLT